MAARRLIAVLLVLLFLSSLAAALAPVEQRDESSTTTTTPLPEPAEQKGELITRVIDASADRPPTIRAAVGDQLQLRVTARRAATIELEDLGASADVDPAAPARFDVLLDTRGRFRIRELESGRRVGFIVVRPRQALTERAPARARSRS